MNTTEKLSRKDVAATYGTDLRSVDRWKQSGLLPKPHRTPAGRPYWTPEQLTDAEKVSLRLSDKATAARVKAAAWLLKKKKQAVKPAARQFGLPLQLNLPVKF